MDGLDPGVTARERVSGVLVAALTAAPLALAACQGPDPPPATAPPPTSTGTPGPLDREERALYRRALRRLETFEARNQPILRTGEATRRARRLYQEHLRDWESGYALLEAYERDGIRIARRPVVLDTEPVSVKDFQDQAAEVVLRRCTDQSDLGMTRDGDPLPAEHVEPVVQEVVVIRYENRTWRIASIETTGEPCGDEVPQRLPERSDLRSSQRGTVAR